MMAPAPAVLASSEYAKLTTSSVDPPTSSTKFGYRAIDVALGGGFDAGRVSCLSGEDSTIISTVGHSSRIVKADMLHNIS